MSDEYILNDHNKEEFPPAHTAEHLLNQLMQRMFGCERSNNAHVERKNVTAVDLLSGKEIKRQLYRDCYVSVDLEPLGAVVLKFKA